MLGGGAVVLLGGLAAGRWFNIGARGGEGAMNADDAFKQALDSKITLVDIRRPDEWARTGVPKHGLALDMRRADFRDALLNAVNGNKEAPIALICARGVRSRGMAAQLAKAGFSNIIDVPEGMLGSGAGPGWVKRGLPVVVPN